MDSLQIDIGNDGRLMVTGSGLTPGEVMAVKRLADEEGWHVEVDELVDPWMRRS